MHNTSNIIRGIKKCYCFSDYEYSTRKETISANSPVASASATNYYQTGFYLFLSSFRYCLDYFIDRLFFIKKKSRQSSNILGLWASRLVGYFYNPLLIILF